MKYLAFDIETARLTPEGEEWANHRPLGISCYALAWRDSDKSGSNKSNSDKIQTTVGHGKDGHGTPQAQMSQEECRALVKELSDWVDQGYTLLTWNGVGFDFDILAEESGMHTACVELARAHIDMMFHFFCLQGYPLGLDTAAKGMGLLGKPEGMDGSQAPTLWQSGEYDKVLAYVAQDVITTLELCEAVNKRGQIRWRTRAGKPNRVTIGHWLSVNEAEKLPLPDNNWIRRPLTRERFTGWMNQQP